MNLGGTLLKFRLLDFGPENEALGKISIVRKFREQGFCVLCSSDGLRLGLGVGSAGAED